MICIVCAFNLPSRFKPPAIGGPNRSSQHPEATQGDECLFSLDIPARPAATEGDGVDHPDDVGAHALSLDDITGDGDLSYSAARLGGEPGAGRACTGRGARRRRWGRAPPASSARRNRGGCGGGGGPTGSQAWRSARACARRTGERRGDGRARAGRSSSGSRGHARCLGTRERVNAARARADTAWRRAAGVERRFPRVVGRTKS